MLDGFLKPKFFSKCKTYLKFTKTRLETIKKKRKAVQKFLKSDIADLLRNGLDINAYGRAEGLLVEQNLSVCFELIETFCGCVSSNLSVMQKQRECPEECREAVSSLMYAAARFAELPELRDLRNMFTERYGNSLETYISKEFTESLRPKSFTKEMKLQLLQDIAKEFSIEWDSKALEQKLYTPPPTQNQHQYGFPSKDADEKYKPHQSNIKNVSRARQKLQSSSEGETLTDFSQDELKTSSSSAGSVSEDDADSKRPFYHKFVPPPYLKPKPETHLENDHIDQKEANTLEEDKPKPRSVRRRNLKPPPGFDNMNKQEPRQGLRTMKGNEGSDRKDEEDSMIDDLLMHYSNKRSPYEAGESTSATSHYRRSRKPELAIRPDRASSLPPEPMSPEAATKGAARTTSLQPEMMSAAGHVHPKLPPDYDELAARIAALRGK